MELLTNPILFPLSFPVLAGLVCLLLPDPLAKARGIVAVAASAIALFLSWAIFDVVRTLPVGMGLLASYCGLIDIRIDHLASFILLAISAIGFLIALYSLGYMREKERLREYYTYLLWTVGASCGAVIANDLILLLVFWGVLGLTLYLMTGLGGPSASSAAKKTFIIIGGSDCFLLLGIVIVLAIAGTTRMDAIRLNLVSEYSYVAFLCFAAAALAKAGAMPLHSWVPDCGEKAPASVAAFLPASIDKLLGIYLFVRTTGGIFVTTPALRTLFMLVGAGTIVFAVMMALVQHDLKRLLSFHAVSQVGYMILGIATGTMVGVVGGLFHMLNNAIYKSSLFLVAGSVEKEAGTTDLDKLGGLARLMPLTFITCIIGAFAISGIPPMNGFFSKWLIYQGIIESGKSGAGSLLWVACLAAAMLGSALTLASFVKVLHAVFLRKASPEISRRPIREVPLSMWLPMIALAALSVVFGVFAWRLPLEQMIIPAVGRPLIIGAWRAGPAAAMLFAAYVLGLVIYMMMSASKTRECRTYIGGEIMEDVYVSGVDGHEPADLEVSGVDFYETVESLPLLHRLYAAGHRSLLDIYDVGSGVVFYFAGALRSAHQGRLPTYLTWLLFGFLAVMWLLMYGIRLI